MSRGESFPPLTDKERREFGRAFANRTDAVDPPWVIAEPLPKRRADPQVIARVAAVDVDGRGDAWLVRALLRATDRGPVLQRVLIEHFNDADREVSGAALRDLRLGAIRDGAVGILNAKDLAWRTTPHGASHPRAKLLRRASQATARKRGPNSYPPEHYVRLARRYLEILDSGGPTVGQKRLGQTSVHQVIAREEERRRNRYVRPETIRSQLRTAATEFGFLTSGGRGRRYYAGPNLYNIEKGDEDA